MKRSKYVALISMAPAVSFILAGCGEKSVDAMVFHSEQDCNDYGVLSREQCRADFGQAQALHQETAPRYTDLSACEAEFGSGQCETAPATAGLGAGLFMPLMAGYLVGRAMSQMGSGARSVPTQPLYTSRHQPGFRTATNTMVANSTGFASVKASQLQPQPARMVQREGFGQQARVRVSAGG